MQTRQNTRYHGSCKVCGQDVMVREVYLEDPSTVRGITLDWSCPATGWWAACRNSLCQHHWGQGTLPERPRDMFPDDRPTAEELRARSIDLGERIEAAKRGEWPKPPEGPFPDYSELDYG